MRVELQSSGGVERITKKIHLEDYKSCFVVGDDLETLRSNNFFRMGHEDNREYQGVRHPSIPYPVEGFDGPSTLFIIPCVSSHLGNISLH